MLYHHKLWPMSLAYLRAADGIALPRGSRAFLSGSINFYRIQDPRDLTADRRWSQLGSDAAPSRSTKHVAEPWIPSETLHGCRCRGQVRFSPNLISIVGALVRPNPHQAIGNEYPIGVVHEVGVARIICGNHRLAQHMASAGGSPKPSARWRETSESQLLRRPLTSRRVNTRSRIVMLRQPWIWASNCCRVEASALLTLTTRWTRSSFGEKARLNASMAPIGFYGPDYYEHRITQERRSGFQATRNLRASGGRSHPTPLGSAQLERASRLNVARLL